MGFIEDAVVYQIIEIIRECFRAQNYQSKVRFLQLCRLEKYIDKLGFDQNIENFTNDFVALLMEQYNQKTSFEDAGEEADIVKLLDFIICLKYYRYGNENDKIENLKSKLKHAESSMESEGSTISTSEEKTEIVKKTLDKKIDTISKLLKEGRVIIVLGRHINWCDRPQSELPWNSNSLYPPTDMELAQYIVGGQCPLSYLIIEGNREIRCSLRKLGLNQSITSNTPILQFSNGDQQLAVEIDLSYLSEYLVLEDTFDEFYTKLKHLFQRDIISSSLHRTLSKVLRKKKNTGCLILTTNYDDLLENTIEAENISISVLSYIAKGKDRGNFRYRSSEDRRNQLKGTVIKDPNKFIKCDPSRESIILKIYGTLDSAFRETIDDGFIVTEDHYIEYLKSFSVSSIMPSIIQEKLVSSNLLFLGYDLNDWRMRAVLDCIWEKQELNYKNGCKTWVVPVGSGTLNRQLWGARTADILDITLKDFVEKLNNKL